MFGDNNKTDKEIVDTMTVKHAAALIKDVSDFIYDIIDNDIADPNREFELALKAAGFTERARVLIDTTFPQKKKDLTP